MNFVRDRYLSAVNSVYPSSEATYTIYILPYSSLSNAGTWQNFCLIGETNFEFDKQIPPISSLFMILTQWLISHIAPCDKDTPLYWYNTFLVYLYSL